MPKKKNPYIIFCLETQQRNPELRGKELPELVGLCSDEWKGMNMDQRAPYIETAKQLEDNPRYQPSFQSRTTIEKAPVEDLTGKFDGFGRSFMAIQSDVIQGRRFENFMKTDIVRTIEDKDQDLLDQRFHIVDVSIWIEDDASEDIIPAEIALIEMTLREGIVRKFVQMIDPGDLPEGFKGEMMINKEKYHDIWLDNNELSDSYDEILDKIVDILKVRGGERFGGDRVSFNTEHGIMEPSAVRCARNQKLLPVYVMPKKKKFISRSIEWLKEQVGHGDRNKLDLEFMFYDVDFLFQQLLKRGNESMNLLTVGAAEAYLTRDVYLYTSTVSCEYHANVESTKCAGAVASRYAYIICDFCCQLYNIPAEEGGHMPWGLTSIPEDDGDSSIDENSSISDSANSSFIDDFSSISAGSENNSIFSDSSEHSVMSVGFGENPLNVELPIESSNRRDDSNIEFEHFYAPFLDENGDIKSEIEFLEDRELVDCDFIDEEMLSMHNRYQDDTRDDEISFDSNRNTPTTYFEVVTGGTEPTFEDFSHVPRGSATRVISPNDSFTTAEDLDSSIALHRQ